MVKGNLFSKEQGRPEHIEYFQGVFYVSFSYFVNVGIFFTNLTVYTHPFDKLGLKGAFQNIAFKPLDFMNCHLYLFLILKL